MSLNLFLYYKKIIKNQLILKLKRKKNDIIPELQKITLNIYLNSSNDKYLIYFYNLCALVLLLSGKFLIVNKIPDNQFDYKKIHLKVLFKKYQMYNFLDMFIILLLPLFQNYNMPLRLKNFDTFGNYYYQINYSDPIFTSKNIITSWSVLNKINFIFFIKSKNKYHSFLLLQYLKFKWY